MRQRGFTLIELAMVLVIMGFIIMTIFPALTTARISSQRSLTQSNLKALMLATASYVQANGCLPCPMTPNAAGTGMGYVRGDGTTPLAPCSKTATSCTAQGIAPYASLGVPASTAHDGWGHWITMAVDPALTYNFGIVPPTAACTATDMATIGTSCLTLSASQKGLCSPKLATNPSPSLNPTRVSILTPNGTTTPSQQSAAVAFISYGTTGYGSYVNSLYSEGLNGTWLAIPASVPTCSGYGGYARCNAPPATNPPSFVDAPPIYGGTDPFDDVLAYADRNALVSMLGNGSCN